MWWREVPSEHASACARAKAPAGQVRIAPTANVSSTATLDASQGPISVGSGSKVCAGAVVIGPVEIGSDCLIGNMAMVRGTTTIGNGVRIGFAAEIKNAIIRDGVLIGPQCFVADSVLERAAYLGALVRTSNHRLDRRNVEVLVDGKRVDTGREKLGCHVGENAALGIQTIVLPGREIASGSIFGPGTIIEKNLPRGRYRLAQQLETF